MPVLEAVANWVETARGALARRLAPQLPCQDCDRWRRCGLYPSAECIARAEQISRGEGRWSGKTRARPTY